MRLLGCDHTLQDVTIRLFDIEAQKTYEQEVETYDLRVKARMEEPGKMNDPWPQFPKAPEPIVDSRDEGTTKPGNFNLPLSGGDYRGSTSDPRSRDQLDFDGNSQSEVKGWSSGWQDNYAEDGSVHEHRTSAPFKTK